MASSNWRNADPGSGGAKTALPGSGGSSATPDRPQAALKPGNGEEPIVKDAVLEDEG